MPVQVNMPKIGKTMTEGVITAWEKKAGDPVRDGDVLFIVNTGKAELEIEANCSGVLHSILAEAGKPIPVGTAVAEIEEGEAPAAVSSSPEKTAASPNGGAGLSVVVIGGGPGGYVAAIRAAQLGASVTLIEKTHVGGTCLNCGCMPTKSLMHAAEIYNSFKNAGGIGIYADGLRVDWTQVQATRVSNSEKLVSGVRALLRANKIKFIEGEAAFVNARTVTAGGQEITADRIIIASGSHPIIPDIPGVQGSGACIDSTACLQLDAVPESMLIIGGGVIGLELGSIYASFGSRITVIEQTSELLPLMDRELTAILREKLARSGLDIHTDSSVLRIQDTEGGALVTARTPAGEQVFQAEKVLICVGRAPNTAGLQLENAGIVLERGFLPVNSKMETPVAGIYAAGDCNGKLMLAHAAMAMGEVAAENALGGSSEFLPEFSPSCAYVGPEFAGVGLTEEQAAQRGLAYDVGRFPISANGKSLVTGYMDGMVKVLTGKPYGEILGVHILAPRATDLIEEAALAIRMECTADELISTIHCHPTVAEALREGVMASVNRAIHMPNKKK